jgi:hypothetical protein
MYFITKKTSKTGLKFQEIEKKIAESKAAVKVILERFGVKKYASDRWAAAGGLECLFFENEPDLNLWKKEKKERGLYSPNGKTKQGKALAKEFADLPRVSRKELNECIGYKNPWNVIGFTFGFDEYFGFSVGEDWGVKIPSDCKEVTTSKYKELFEKE